jgi:hypothetical protein
MPASTDLSIAFLQDVADKQRLTCNSLGLEAVRLARGFGLAWIEIDDETALVVETEGQLTCHFGEITADGGVTLVSAERADIEDRVFREVLDNLIQVDLTLHIDRFVPGQYLVSSQPADLLDVLKPLDAFFQCGHTNPPSLASLA